LSFPRLSTVYHFYVFYCVCVWFINVNVLMMIILSENTVQTN